MPGPFMHLCIAHRVVRLLTMGATNGIVRLVDDGSAEDQTLDPALAVEFARARCLTDLDQGRSRRGNASDSSSADGWQ